MSAPARPASFRPPRPAPQVAHPGDERIPARLIAIASDHMRRFGPDRVTVVAVAAEAGMSHANVYRFFASKTALVEAVVATWLRSVEVTLGDIANAPDPADDKLERLLLQWGKLHRDKLETDMPVYQALARAWEKRQEIVANHRARIRHFITQIVDEGMVPGPLRVKDEERAVAFVIDAMQRFVHPHLMREARELARPQHDSRLSASVRVIVRGLVIGSI